MLLDFFGGIFKTEMWSQQKEWETKLDKQQNELKKLLRKYDEKLIEMDIRLSMSRKRFRSVWEAMM